MNTKIWLPAALGAAALAAAAWMLWLRPHAPEPAAAPVPAIAAPQASAPEPAAAVAVLPAPPAVGTAPLEPLNAAGIRPALNELLGGKATALALWSTEDFAHHVVATVDNLAREHVRPLLWPVMPTSGRFMVESGPDGDVISADNASRYTPFVLMVESIDAGRAVALYARLQPMLQTAYADLGYPKQDFNKRLLEVIDVLLAAPERPYPVKLTLTKVKGEIPSQRPWVRYEFADPALEALPAGQKMLLRMGAVNERRMKTQLRAFRQQLVQRFGLR